MPFVHSIIQKKKGYIKLRKRLKRLLGIALAAVLVISVPCAEAKAAEEIQTVAEDVVELEAHVKEVDYQAPDYSFYAVTINDAIITMSFGSSGIVFDFETTMNREASVVGVKDIKIQKKVWYGWTTVATSSGAEEYNCYGCTIGLTYSGAEIGETYRVSCVHYGTVNGESRELANETSGFVFTY